MSLKAYKLSELIFFILKVANIRCFILIVVSFGYCIVCPSIYRLLVTPMVSFGYCIVCPSIYHFWLLLWYLLVIVLSFLWFTAFWLLLWYLLVIVLSVLQFTAFWLPLWYLLVIVLYVLRFTTSDYSCGIFKIVLLFQCVILTYYLNLKRKSMGVAWVGILPRQGVLGRSTFFVVFSFC